MGDREVPPAEGGRPRDSPGDSVRLTKPHGAGDARCSALGDHGVAASPTEGKKKKNKGVM